MILAELPAYADEFEFEDFESDINYCFKNYLYKKVFVEGKDHGLAKSIRRKNFYS